MSTGSGGREPYDCLLIPRGLLARVAADRRRAEGGSPGSEPEAYLHSAMFSHVFERYGHLLGLAAGEVGRLRGKQVSAGDYAQHDLFVLDDDGATLLVPKGLPGAGAMRYDLTPLQDGAYVGRLARRHPSPLPPPVPVEAPPGEDPRAHARRLELLRIRDGRSAPAEPEADRDA
jgi:hypothetical protein